MKKFVIVSLLMAFITIIIGSLNTRDINVIKFFPLDETKKLYGEKTDLTFLSEGKKDDYQVAWSIQSNIEEPVFLRQDLSLLFIDGILKGILNQWKEDADKLQQETIFSGENSSHLEAISFHHGEIHYPDESIKSTQKMTYDELYVIEEADKSVATFKEPVTPSEIEWKKNLDRSQNKKLTTHWQQLMDHFQIDKNNYVEIPLVDLHYYEKEPFPNLTLSQTQQVIGQLWEGLYRHYLLGIQTKNEAENPLNTFMPLILVHEKGDHLIVLYEDASGKKQRLLQQIPAFNAAN